MYYYRLRLRDAADASDALVVTSVPGGVNPYISEAPSGDGQAFDPRTGATEVGAYQVRIADNGSAANAITGFLSDGAGRYDKLGRRAYLEYGTDGTTFPSLLVAGYVTKLSYPSAAEAMVSIGEAQRAERTKQAFAVASPTFPATTMLGGGPVRWPAGVVTPVNWPDRGPWTVKLFVSDALRGIMTLTFVSGYVLADENATDFTRVTDGAFPPYMFQRLNTLISTEVPGAVYATFIDIAYTQVGNLYVDVYSGGVFVATLPVVSLPNRYAIGTLGNFAVAWPANTDPLGTQYQVYLYTLTVSENSPLHVLQHPMAIVTGLITAAGELWDATSAAAITASIGADVRVFLRLTASEPTDAFIAKLMGLFGFGRRINAANAWEFFDARAKPTTTPGTSITLDDLREEPSDLWELDDATIINTVTVTTERFAVWAPGQSSARTPDGLVPVEQKRSARFQLADGTFPDLSQGVKEASYDLPGTILNVNGAELDLTAFTTSLAAPVFDRWGYGAPETPLVCRSSVAAAIGDEVVLNLAHHPNGSARGGQRIVQVVQRTNNPGGPVLRVEDAGVAAQPSLAPAFTIVPSARNADTQADVALTNAAALATAGVVAVLVEFAVSASSPSVAGQDLGSIRPIAPVTLATPPTAAGSTVWARAKSLQPGKRSGGFTAWAGVTLTSVGAPAGVAFTAVAGDGSVGTLTWTAGANSSSYAVRLQLRLSAFSAANDTPIADLLPGSVAASLTGLTPGASYTATVQYIDAVTGIRANATSITFTAGGTTLTLPAPTSPAGIVGSTDANGVSHVDGTYGLDVTAALVPGVIEFWQAIETAIGSGVFGAAALALPTAAVNGAATSYRAVAPHDRLLRQLYARQVRQGTAASDFTYPVTLDPWGAVMGTPDAAEMRDVTWTETDTLETVQFSTSPAVAEVWAGCAVVNAPGTASDFDTLVAPFVVPLSHGATTFPVPRPGDGQVTLVQLEPRRADLSAGTVRRLTITATPQVPHVEPDDIETATTGTQFIKITERGIAVASVLARTQVGTSPISGWAAPTRAPGAASSVRPTLSGGILQAGEWEQDASLDPDRSMYIEFQLTLANGKVIGVGPFQFDWDKNPNLFNVSLLGTKVTIQGDSDTKAIGLYSKTRAWKYETDGVFATIDVAGVGTNGAAGLGSGASDTFTAKALSDPVVELGVGTLSDARDIVVAGASAPPAAAAWDIVTALAPAFVGDDEITITLKATAAPAGWTAQVWLSDPGAAVNVSSLLTPALSGPPTVSTAYTYAASRVRVGRFGDSTFISVTGRADLLDNLGVVRDTRTISVGYWVADF